MLLHIGSGPNVLMSIPRDSNVEIPGRGTNKINAAFAFGGPKLLVRTVESSTGIHVDDYVEIGFTGMVNLVDAVGGIEICPKQDMKDPDAKLDIEAGCQEADGETALGYARSRKLFQTGDIQRAENQREVVSSIGRRSCPGRRSSTRSATTTWSPEGRTRCAWASRPGRSTWRGSASR